MIVHSFSTILSGHFFAKVSLKVTVICVVVSVDFLSISLSLRVEQLCHNWTDFSEIGCWKSLLTSGHWVKVWLKLDENIEISVYAVYNFHIFINVFPTIQYQSPVATFYNNLYSSPSSNRKCDLSVINVMTIWVGSKLQRYESALVLVCSFDARHLRCEVTKLNRDWETVLKHN